MTFVAPDRRYRLFFDETGNGDLRAGASNPNERYLSLTGIVIRQDTHDGYVTRRLNALKRDLLDPDNGADIVLHRRDIMRKTRKFAVLQNDNLRQEFDARILSIISECVQVAFTISIDKKAHFEKYNVWQHSPYHYTMQCLVERFVYWLKRRNYIGDVVGEARNSTHDKQLRRAYRRLGTNPGSYLKLEDLAKHLTSKELKLFPKERNQAGLQIADILAHPAHRALRQKQLQQESTADYGTILAYLLERKLHDRKSNGVISGYGTKWLP